MNPAVSNLIGRIQYLGSKYEEQEKLFATKHAWLQEMIVKRHHLFICEGGNWGIATIREVFAEGISLYQTRTATGQKRRKSSVCFDEEA